VLALGRPPGPPRWPRRGGGDWTAAEYDIDVS
jgi:hypothetical protein